MDAAARTSSDETIFALSSGRPPAAIAVIRISGDRAGAVLAAMAGRLPAPRHATLTDIRTSDGALIDRGLALWFPGPASATGEDLAELHLHGGVAIVAAASRAIEASGVRPAIAGEFTRRAFVNGKIDDGEVETLGDLLTAQTELQRRVAADRLEDRSWSRIGAWHRRLIELCAQVEAAIDYGDEVEDDGATASTLEDAVRGIVAEMSEALAATPSHRLRDGVRVVIAGPPNSGKSSLFNALCQADAAIVAPTAGTTRDLNERALDIGGVPIVLIDTAGVRDADDPVERLGIERALAATGGADVVLQFGRAARSDDREILLSGKSDVEPIIDGRLPISPLTGAGIEALRAALLRKAAGTIPPPGNAALGQLGIVCVERSQEALTGVRDWSDLSVSGEALGIAARALEPTSSFHATSEAILDTMFARFCLGK